LEPVSESESEFFFLEELDPPIRALISGVWNRNWNQNWNCFYNRLELKANCQFQSRFLGTGTEPNLCSKTRTRTQARSFFFKELDPEADFLVPFTCGFQKLRF
jgi:hypothetical protein